MSSIRANYSIESLGSGAGVREGCPGIVFGNDLCPFGPNADFGRVRCSSGPWCHSTLTSKPSLPLLVLPEAGLSKALSAVTCIIRFWFENSG